MLKNVKKFFELVKTNETLARKVFELNERLKKKRYKDDHELVIKEILPLARESGFDFTADEFVRFAQDNRDKLLVPELGDVAGGITKKSAVVGLLTSAALLSAPTAIENIVEKDLGFFKSASAMDPNSASEEGMSYMEDDEVGMRDPEDNEEAMEPAPEVAAVAEDDEANQARALMKTMMALAGNLSADEMSTVRELMPLLEIRPGIRRATDAVAAAEVIIQFFLERNLIEVNDGSANSNEAVVRLALYWSTRGERPLQKERFINEVVRLMNASANVRDLKNFLSNEVGTELFSKAGEGIVLQPNQDGVRAALVLQTLEEKRLVTFDGGLARFDENMVRLALRLFLSDAKVPIEAPEAIVNETVERMKVCANDYKKNLIPLFGPLIVDKMAKKIHDGVLSNELIRELDEGAICPRGIGRVFREWVNTQWSRDLNSLEASLFPIYVATSPRWEIFAEQNAWEDVNRPLNIFVDDLLRPWCNDRNNVLQKLRSRCYLLIMQNKDTLDYLEGTLRYIEGKLSTGTCLTPSSYFSIFKTVDDCAVRNPVSETSYSEYEPMASILGTWKDCVEHVLEKLKSIRFNVSAMTVAANKKLLKDIKSLCDAMLSHNGTHYLWSRRVTTLGLTVDSYGGQVYKGEAPRYENYVLELLKAFHDSNYDLDSQKFQECLAKVYESTPPEA